MADLLPDEVSESDLAPDEVPADDLAAEEASDTTTVMPDGAVRRELMKLAPDLSEPEPAPEEPGLLDRVLETVKGALSPETATGAFAAGTTSGATLGFGDEIYGAIGADSKMNEQRAKTVEDVDEAKRTGRYDPGAGAPAIPGVTSWQLKREGQPTLTENREAKTAPSEPENPNAQAMGDAYRAARDSMREQFSTAEKKHPGAYLGGELLGSLALPLPGPGKAKGLAKVGKYALQGAGIGTATGLGNSEADLTEGDVKGALLDTGAGTAGGAAFGGLLGAGAAKLDPYLEQLAARRGFKALDPYMKSISDALESKLGRNPSPAEVMSEVERLGKRALDEGIIPEGRLERFASSETLGNRAADLREEAGVLKGAFVDHAQQQLGGNPVSIGTLATNIEAEAQAARLRGQQGLSRKLDKEAAELRQTIVDRASAGFADPAAQTLQEAEKMKTLIQGDVFGAGRPGGAGQRAKETVARLAKEQAEKAIESGLGPEDLDQFIALKGRYGDLANLSDIASHGAIRGFRNQAVGLGDKAAAGIGATIAGAPGAAAAGSANNFLRKRGDAGLARTLSNASKSNDLLTPAANLEPWSRFLRDDEPGVDE